MSQTISQSLQNSLLNLVFAGGTFTNAGTYNLGFCTGLSATTVTGEPTVGTNGYARQTVNVGSSGVFTVTNGVVTNNALIQTPPSTGAWASGTTMTYWFLASSASGTTWLVGGQLNGANQFAVTVANQAFQFPASSLTLTETGW